MERGQERVSGCPEGVLGDKEREEKVREWVAGFREWEGVLGEQMGLEMAEGLGAMPRSLGSSHATAENGQDKAGYARLRRAFQKDALGIRML